MEKLSIVVPCYNEEEVLELFYTTTIKVVEQVQEKYDYEFVFIDDGSKDKTLEILKKLREEDSHIHIISFSRNFGKEAAIYAGLSNCIGDLVVVMDADLQHPPAVLPEMLKGIEDGYDTVTTKRMNRKGEGRIKSVFSRCFYSLMKKLTKTEIVNGAQDFRMMKRIVVDAILSLKEYNRFSKGIFSWVGFKVKYIEIENVERAAGETKWSLKSLFRYAIEGILAFSTSPLRISTVVGAIISLFAIILGICILGQTLIYGKDVPGYASTITTILFMGGIQLLSIGIIGEYIAKMYMEIKDRPKYLIREDIKSENEDKKNKNEKNETT